MIHKIPKIMTMFDDYSTYWCVEQYPQFKMAIDQLNGNLGQFQLNPGQL